MKKTMFVNPPPVKVNNILLNDEWDKAEMKEKLLAHDRTIVFGNYPGVGKSTACKQTGLNTLFVAPYNKQCQELRKDLFEAITEHRLMGINETGTFTHEYDVDDYQCIVFDELALCDTIMLVHIYQYMRAHNGIRFYATADTDQNKPIGYGTNNVDLAEYYPRCMSILFPNQIMLQESKRLTRQEDRDKLKMLKRDILNKSIPVMDTFQRTRIQHHSQHVTIADTKEHRIL